MNQIRFHKKPETPDDEFLLHVFPVLITYEFTFRYAPGSLRRSITSPMD